MSELDVAGGLDGYEPPMRDWIGTGISLLGFALVVITVVQMMRTRRRRSTGKGRSAPGGRDPLLQLCAGLVILEAGQLIQAESWPWATLHLVPIGFIAAAALFVHRDLQNGQRRPR